MATISRMRRLVNPGRRRRNGIIKRTLSPLQKLFFGTKRQRAAVAKNAGKKRAGKRFRLGYGSMAQLREKVASSARRRRRNAAMGYRGSTPKPKSKFSSAKVYFKKRNARRRRRNVGSIISVRPKGNPSRRRYKRRRSKVIGYDSKGYAVSSWPFSSASRGKKVRRRKRSNTGMARTRRRRASNPRRYHRRRRHVVNPRRRRRARRNVVYQRRIKRGMYAYSSNPRRRRSYGRRVHHRRHYRRNPGMLTGTMGRIVGTLGGVALTGLLSAAVIPAGLSTGIIGYFSTGVVAVLQGKIVGKLTKSSALGNDFMIGGLAYLAVKIVKDFFGYSVPGFAGMGLIGGSSFYVPQVNRNGSMGSFILPGAVGGAIAAIPTKAGMGVMRRTGRLM